MNGENLHRGEWITMHEYLGRAPLFGPEPSFSGEPYQVQAVSFPFVSLKSLSNRVFALDLREFRVTKLNRQYVSSFRRRKRRKRHKIASRDERVCHRCGGPMVERFTDLAGWHMYCQECRLVIPLDGDTA